MLRPRPGSERRNVSRSEDVVEHCFRNMLLHQRHVLVRRGMKDRVRPIQFEDRLQPSEISNVGDDRHDLDMWERALHFLGQFEDRVLTSPERDYALRFETRDLATQLTSDRAARAADQHHFTGAQRTDLSEISSYGFAAKQILNLDLPKSANRFSAGENLVQT